MARTVLRQILHNRDRASGETLAVPEQGDSCEESPTASSDLADNQGRAPWLCGLSLLGGVLLREALFLAELELRLREDVELQREAPVFVQKGDPGAVPVALAAFAGVDDVDGVLLRGSWCSPLLVCRGWQLSHRSRRAVFRDTENPGRTEQGFGGTANPSAKHG